MSWQSIPAINSLQRDMDQEFPGRVTPDWILGDADHSSRVSDHNPASDGDVHAIDIRLGGKDLPGINSDGSIPRDVRRLLNAVIGDRRVKYVIFNWKIYSRTYGWEARRYTGTNGHTTHVHVSFRYEPEHERDTSEWFGDTKRRTRPRPVDLSEVRDQFLKALDLRDGRVQESIHVKRVQRALNTRYPNRKVRVDGLVGDDTLDLWAHHEKTEGGKGRNRVPDDRSLGRLLQPRWKMVP